MRYSCALLFAAAAGLVAQVAVSAQNPQVGPLVVAGDSLSAGYQNNQLIDCYPPYNQGAGAQFCFSKPSGQRFGYANLVATQAGDDLNLPLIPPPGFPQVTNVDGFDVAAGLTPIPRENNNQTFDVAVPGFTVQALVGYQAACPNPANTAVPLAIQILAAEILNPTDCTAAHTELQEAATLAATNPGTSILWIGSNDALFPLLFYGQKATDPLTFAYLYNIAISAMAQSSKHLVVANIPDVTLLPYLTSVPKLAAMLHISTTQAEQTFGLHRGDMVTPYAFYLIGQMQQKNPPAYTPLPPFIVDPISGQSDDPVVIPAVQIIALKASVDIYNAEIAIEAALHHATLVDIHSLVNRIAANGVTVNGQTLTTSFGGGLFSLDGVHPSNTGYAVIANAFIDAMNRRLGAGMQEVNVAQTAANDPMVFPPSQQNQSTSHVSRSMADGLRSVFSHRW